MAWRGDSWAEIVARTASATTRNARPIDERESAETLAARAQPWPIPSADVSLRADSLVLGRDVVSTVEVAFGQLYHVEPVDPWPCLALGWVDRGEAYSTVLSPQPEDVETFAATVTRVVAECAERAPRATVSGWLGIPELPWEPVDALPDERAEALEVGSYRSAPAIADPILATRTIAIGEARLLTWLAARLRLRPNEPRHIVLTRRFVYVRTRTGVAWRIPASTLRAARRAVSGDTVYVFGRNTKLLLVHQAGCELATHLDALLTGERSE